MNYRILAIDASTEACSAAVMDAENIVSRFEVCPRDHTKRLLPMVDDVLKQSGLKLTELDAIAFGRGPGSFTGVRIGIGVAQGLAFGAGLQMVGISTLEAMALAAHRQTGANQVIAAIDARMSEVYVAAYHFTEDNKIVGVVPEQVIAPERFSAMQHLEGEWVGVGTGWGTYSEQLSGCADSVSVFEAVRFPQASDIAVLASQQLDLGLALNPDQIEPVYLRDKVTWKKMPGRD